MPVKYAKIILERYNENESYYFTWKNKDMRKGREEFDQEMEEYRSCQMVSDIVARTMRQTLKARFKCHFGIKKKKGENAV